jgi:hypothetical protein
VHSAVENRYINSLAKNGCWLGGIRRSTSKASPFKKPGPGNDHWEWSDGEAWKYYNWAPGEPNNFFEIETRVEMTACG